jgi:tetratricopeptide (TPR) repeat protein
MQIMDMGYTPSQARSAFAQTSTGLDIQAAVDILLTSGPNDHDASPTFEDRDVVFRERQRREEEEAERRRRRRAGPSRSSIRPRTKDEQRQQEEARGEYGEQAEKIIAQASEIGQSFLKNATTFWNSGKEKALRMYEEQRKALEAEQAATKGKGRERKDGRPRWMVETEENGEGRDENSSAGAFKDSDEEEDRIPASRPSARDRPRAQQPPAPKPLPQGEARRLDDDLLGGGDAPKSYQPASRHRVHGRHATASPRPPPQSPKPQTLSKRNLIEASSSQIQHSMTHKAKGNEHFKLGRFAEAESAYTTAISSLPEGHLFLVPIYNNRAAARIKLGESASAAEDCSVVITIVGPTYHPAKEAPLPPDHAEVKLGDALVKATTKRAQAWEMAEKWSKALEDWERVLGFDAVLLGGAASSTRSLASEGIKRSRKMLEPPKEDSSTQSGSSRAPPKLSQPIRTVKAAVSDPGKSKAVGELRKANQAAEAEEAQRMAAKDSVDAKILAWKGGKETNLRALIASLDTVLWDEILSGGLKVGMHELITEKQVKIKYMKVIARLHPDKVSFREAGVNCALKDLARCEEDDC